MERGVGSEPETAIELRLMAKLSNRAIEHIMRRHSDDKRGAHPDWKNGKLNCRRHADQISAPHVVRIGKPGRDPDNGRYEEAAERALESHKKNWSALNSGNHRSASDREHCAHQKRPKPLHDELAGRGSTSQS